MNGSILHQDSTTSSHMGTNTAQFAIYPAFIAVGLPDGTVARGGIIFLSTDLKHDRHQVKVFRNQIMAFVKDKFNVEVKVELRWSDQCSGQFKSQYPVFDLVSTDLDITVHWCFFEVGEGKNLSDLLGSLFKKAYIRGVAISSKTSGTAHSIAEVMILARPHLATSSKKFDFIEIKEVQPFDRQPMSSDLGVVIPHLRKQLHLTRTSDGQLITREISCKSCLELKDKLCTECKLLPPVPATPVARRKVGQEEVEDEEDVELDAEQATEDDGGDSDKGGNVDSDESDDEEGEKEEFGPGAIVWARILRWHPATILAPSDVPASLSHLLQQSSVPSVFIKRFIIDDIKVVPLSRITMLASNKIDRERASKTPEIRDAYDASMAQLRGDF